MRAGGYWCGRGRRAVRLPARTAGLGQGGCMGITHGPSWTFPLTPGESCSGCGCAGWSARPWAVARRLGNSFPGSWSAISAAHRGCPRRWGGGAGVSGPGRLPGTVRTGCGRLPAHRPARADATAYTREAGAPGSGGRRLRLAPPPQLRHRPDRRRDL